MEERKTYISRPAEGEDLYSNLQQSTLDRLQQLSGEVWTDYNPHDTGVTIADVANYALTELAYKLGFDLEDYLTDSNGTYCSEHYGLFSSAKAYPVSPVTADDYRKLILANFPMIENVKVETAEGNNGVYNFRLRLSPFLRENDYLIQQVRSFFYMHRNLCENIGEVSIVDTKDLAFTAEIEILPEADATEILAKVFYTAMKYLAGSVHMKSIKDQATEDFIAEEWYDGPVGNLKISIPNQKDTETELYWKFMGINGIVSLKTCYFYEVKDDEEILLTKSNLKTDFKDGYSLIIPKNLDNIKIRVQQKEVFVDINRLREKLQALYFTRGTSRMRFFLHDHKNGNQNDSKEQIRKANYRNVYEHYPISNDLPRYYRIGGKDNKSYESSQKDKEDDAKNFGGYLKLFDLVIERGLSELDGVKQLLSIIEESDISRIALSLNGNDESDNLHRDIIKEKSRFLDFIDALYGVNSDLAWLKKFNFYGETENSILLRRMKFLRAVPVLMRNRYKACNIQTMGPNNIATIKQHISMLLGFTYDERISVGNVLPSNNLVLMESMKHRKQLALGSMLVPEMTLNAETAIPIAKETVPQNDELFERYEDLRHNMPIFNTNWINDGLFRNGTNIEKYKLMKMGNDYLLVFHNEEEGKWMNLGRSKDCEKLSAWANALQWYLQDLNRQCEAVYVIEKNLFEPAEPFTVAFVFAGWTTRTHSTRFRSLCEQQVRSMLPAHLKMETYWLNPTQMQCFEMCYHTWLKGLNGTSIPVMQQKCQEEMMKIVTGEVQLTEDA